MYLLTWKNLDFSHDQGPQNGLSWKKKNYFLLKMSLMNISETRLPQLNQMTCIWVRVNVPLLVSKFQRFFVLFCFFLKHLLALVG